MSSIADNLELVRERIALAAARAGRDESSVTLVAVTKTVPADRIRQAILAGVTDVGENRVQEAEEKYAPFGGPGRERISLHMIGSLQRNKARRAAAFFDMVQSVDRPELALALDRAAGEERSGPLPVLLEVNMTGEASKSGVVPSELESLASVLDGCPHLRAEGLMAMARMGANERELRATFQGLRGLLEGLRQTHARLGLWRHLSMGMSDDFEIAIEEGATIVRVGRAIFGARG